MKRVVWASTAEKKRDAALLYIARDSINAALSQAEEIVRQTRLLREQPNMGRPGKLKGTRELVIRHTPFIVGYRLKDDIVQIIRFLHSSQNR